MGIWVGSGRFQGFSLESSFVCVSGILLIVVCHIVECLYPSVKLILDVLEEFGLWVGVWVICEDYFPEHR